MKHTANLQYLILGKDWSINELQAGASVLILVFQGEYTAVFVYEEFGKELTKLWGDFFDFLCFLCCKKFHSFKEKLLKVIFKKFC